MNEDEEAEEILLESDVEKLSIPAKTDVWERFTITKTHYPDRMALIRVGDFYELLDQDAVEASDALELTLTGRSVPDRPTRVPMCGFPYHTLDKYLQKLQDKGFKVVIAEEDNAELNMDKRENEIVDGAEEQSEDERDENSRTRSDRTDR